MKKSHFVGTLEVFKFRIAAHKRQSRYDSETILKLLTIHQRTMTLFLHLLFS